ncbi:MAG: hypothetical protein KF775_08190 [Cyclobacteriaceae bacterium]|nr:hypothetical protein [Cyclobacteriaceae bacterium]
MNFENQLRPYAHQPITHQLLVSVLSKFKQPNDKIHKLLRDGVIIPIKKGLYIAGPSLNSGKSEPFLLANHILGPSYISLETALAYHGFIPERVYEIASITTKASRTFKTTVGTFTYTRIPLPYYAFGFNRVMLEQNQYALVATPAKAICDKVITTSGLLFRSKKTAYAFLVENMRIDEDKLKEIDTRKMAEWILLAPKQESLRMILNAIQEL